ncbi:MAG: hypothetical protein PW788_09015 [Micavibrio sp.]|nr:hypothetical protein [Micavibrio sp.]
MSNFNANSPLFLGSAALNIFLVAFILGRLTGAPHFGPPPWAHDGQHQQDFMRDMAGAGKGDRERPPLFGPDDLFTKEEREANIAAVNPLFDKAQALRESFAKHLKDHAVTKEEVVKHFESVDKIMETLIRTMQDRAAVKMAALPEEERKKFAEHLLEMRMPPRDGIGVPGLITPSAVQQQGGDDHDFGSGFHGGPPDNGPDGNGPGHGHNHDASNTQTEQP